MAVFTFYIVSAIVLEVLWNANVKIYYTIINSTLYKRNLFTIHRIVTQIQINVKWLTTWHVSQFFLIYYKRKFFNAKKIAD